MTVWVPAAAFLAPPHQVSYGAEVSVALTVAVDYGVEIPKLARAAQRAVREAVGSMTGLGVRSVDVNVEVVELSEAEQQKLNEVAEMLDDNVFDASPDSLVANEAELEPIEPVAPADAGSDNSAVNAAEDGVQ